MMKELFLVGLAAGVGGILLGKFGGTLDAKVASWGVPPIVGHAVLVGSSAAGVYYVTRKVL